MAQREHPRVQLPLLVELQHPSFNRGRSFTRDGSGAGKRATDVERCIARDISEGGVFVHLDVPPSIKPGAKLRLTLLNPSSVDHQPTPTVDMVVKRVEDNGLGLAFVNSASRHLWRSVERLRDELAIGRDYFQVHQSAIVVNERGQLLIVQQYGKWGYPGEYLIVGEEWQSAIKSFLAHRFELTDLNVVELLTANSGPMFDLPEAAVFKTFVLISANAADFSLNKSEQEHKDKNEQTRPYQSFRWVEHKRAVDELTFANDEMRRLAYDVLKWADNEYRHEGN
ncbi:MAG: PilZ domain-containing protein [Gammaproteobacteria bacterium]|nr:PilZ domain-containing protein [Gammaproteobacteria bacterium]